MPWQFPRLPRLMTGWFGTAGGAGRASRLAPPAAVMGVPGAALWPRPQWALPLPRQALRSANADRRWRGAGQPAGAPGGSSGGTQGALAGTGRDGRYRYRFGKASAPTPSPEERRAGPNQLLNAVPGNKYGSGPARLRGGHAQGPRRHGG